MEHADYTVIYEKALGGGYYAHIPALVAAVISQQVQHIVDAIKVNARKTANSGALVFQLVR